MASLGKFFSSGAGTVLLVIMIFSALPRVADLGSTGMVADEYIYYTATMYSCANPLFPLSIYANHLWFFDQPWLGMYVYSIACAFKSVVSFRMITAMFSIATVPLVFLIGRKLFDKRAGLLSAFMFASSIPVIAYGRIGIFDSLLVFFMALSVYLYLEEKRSGWFAAGMSIGVKYSGAILLPLFMANDKFIRKRKIGLKKAGAWAAGVIMVLFTQFLAWDSISPRLGLNVQVPIVIKTLIYQMISFPVAAGQNIASSSGMFILDKLLAYFQIIWTQTGPVISALFIIGAYYSYNTRDGGLRFSMLWAIFGFLFAMALNLTATRYILPFIIPFYMVASFSLFRLLKKNAALLCIVLAFIICIGMYDVAATHPDYLLYGTVRGGAEVYGQFTQQTFDYINSDIPAGSTIYWETYTHHYPNYKDTGYNMFFTNPTTTDLGSADYAVMDREYLQNHGDTDEVKNIRNNFRFVAAIGRNGIEYVWIYSRASASP